MLVGNNHTADGQSKASKITGDRDKFKVGYMKSALQQAQALASSQGLEQVLVAGDWNMTYELVEKAFRVVGGGEWEVSNGEERNDFIVANCAVRQLPLKACVRAWDRVHTAQVAQMPLRHRGAGAGRAAAPRSAAEETLRQEATRILELLQERRARMEEEELRKQLALEDQVAKLDARCTALEKEKLELDCKIGRLRALMEMSTGADFKPADKARMAEELRAHCAAMLAAMGAQEDERRRQEAAEEERARAAAEAAKRAEEEAAVALRAEQEAVERLKEAERAAEAEAAKRMAEQARLVREETALRLAEAEAQAAEAKRRRVEAYEARREEERQRQEQELRLRMEEAAQLVREEQRVQREFEEAEALKKQLETQDQAHFGSAMPLPECSLYPRESSVMSPHVAQARAAPHPTNSLIPTHHSTILFAGARDSVSVIAALGVRRRCRQKLGAHLPRTRPTRPLHHRGAPNK